MNTQFTAQSMSLQYPQQGLSPRRTQSQTVNPSPQFEGMFDVFKRNKGKTASAKSMSAMVSVIKSQLDNPIEGRQQLDEQYTRVLREKRQSIIQSVEAKGSRKKFYEELSKGSSSPTRSDLDAMRYIGNEDEMLRRGTARKLSEISNPELFDTSVERLVRDSEASVRQIAALRVKDIHYTPLREALVELLINDSDARVREAVSRLYAEQTKNASSEGAGFPVDIQFSGLFSRNTTSQNGPQPLDIKKLQKQALKEGVSLTLDTEHGKTLDVDIQPDAYVQPDDEDIEYQGNFLSAKLVSGYGVKWSMEKCVRDIFQNFSDAHGSTLEGVSLDVKKLDDETYDLVISGQGEYDHDLLEKLGATTKSGDDKAAGGFGEGAKVLSLIMLREPVEKENDDGDDKNHDGEELYFDQSLAEEMVFSSRNWSYTFKMDYEGETDKDSVPLLRRFDLREDRPGNYLKIRTKNKAFVKKLIEGLNYFYHVNNQDFVNPTYENENGGFKLLDLEDRGNLYVTGQRFQYTDPIHDKKHWEEGLEGITLWSTDKVERWDRDRSSIGPREVSSKINAIVDEMTNEDVSRLILELQDAWEDKDVKNSLDGKWSKRSKIKDYFGHTATKQLLDALIDRAERKGIKVDFPDKWISLSRREKENMGHTRYMQLKAQGYKFFDADMRKAGMATGAQFEPVDYKSRFDKVGRGAAKTGKFVATPFVFVAGGLAAAGIGVGEAGKAVGNGFASAGRAVKGVVSPPMHAVGNAVADGYDATRNGVGKVFSAIGGLFPEWERKPRKEKTKKKLFRKDKTEHVVKREKVDVNQEQAIRLEILTQAAKALGESAKSHVSIYDHMKEKELGNKTKIDADAGRGNVWLDKYVLNQGFSQAVIQFIEQLKKTEGYDHTGLEESMEGILKDFLKLMTDSSESGRGKYLEMLELKTLWDYSKDKEKGFLDNKLNLD